MSEEQTKQVWDNLFAKLNEEEITFLAVANNEKNKEIERLQHNQEVSTKWEIKLTQKNTKLKEENKRLNNIIYEFEKWLEEEIKSTKEIIKVCDDEEDRGIYLDKVYNYKDVLEKLKELKGSDKE